MTTLRAGLRPRRALRLGLALSGWIALAVAITLPDGAFLRVLITTAFLLLCPGLAAVRWARPTPWREREWPVVLETVLMALVLSLCLAVLAVEPFYLSGSFTTTRVLIALAAVTSVLALLPGPGGIRPEEPRPVPYEAPPPPGTEPLPEAGGADGPGATVRAEPDTRSEPSRGHRVRENPEGSGGRVPVAIVGAGPYGLATACYLGAAHVPLRIFGEAMETWRAHMPEGMFLQTVPAASAIATPEFGHRFVDFRAAQGVLPEGDRHPVPLAEYLDYGRWFQKRLVPELEPRRVRRIRTADGGFSLLLDSDQELLAASVVLATGAVPFAYVPRELHQCTMAGLASHTSQHTDLRRFAGQRLAVLGAGQSALEYATLLHEAGAHVTVIARTATIVFDPPPPDGASYRPHHPRLLDPHSPLGRGRPLLAACCHGGAACRLLPAPVRMQLLRTVPRPSGAWWLKERADGRFPVLLGCTLLAAVPRDETVCLQLVTEHGGSETLVADHVLAATGYRVNMHRLELLEPGLRQALRMFAGAPVLSSGFESSVPGLYFTGLAAAPTFGPLLMFVTGTDFAARRLTVDVAARKRW